MQCIEHLFLHNNRPAVRVLLITNKKCFVSNVATSVGAKLPKHMILPATLIFDILLPLPHIRLSGKS